MVLGLKKTVVDFLWMQGRTFIGLFLGLISSAIVARKLGPEGKGILAVAPLLPSLLQTFINCGMEPANVVFIPEGKVSIKTAFSSSVLVGIILSLIGVGIGCIVMLFWGGRLFPSIPHKYIYFYIFTMPIALIGGFLGSIINGQQRFKEYAHFTLVIPIFELVFLLIFLCIFNLNVWSVLLTSLLSSGLSFCAALYFLREWISFKLFSEENYIYIKRILGFGITCHISNIVSFFNYKIGLYIVSIFLTLSNVGIYSMGVALAERLWIISSGMSSVLLPKMSELHDDPNLRDKFTGFMARWIFFAGIGAGFFAYFLIVPFVKVMYGIHFLKVISVFRIMLPGVVFFSFSRVLANNLAAQKRPLWNLLVSVIGVGLNIILSYCFIFRWNVLGAALATSAVYFLCCYFTYLIFMHFSHMSHKSFWQFNEFDSRMFSFLRNAFCNAIRRKVQ